MTTHTVKTWREVFQDVWDHKKTFEVRRDDRGYAVGDFLVQNEYDRMRDACSNRSVRSRIIYKLDGGQFGIEPGYCVLGLDTMNSFFED